MKNVVSTWVSLLYVPGADSQKLAEACHTEVDAIIVDLEDFVPAERKSHARAHVDADIAAVRRAQRHVVVRVNRRLDLLVRDLEATVIAGVDAIMLTKVNSAAYVQFIDEFVGFLERERGLPIGGIGLIPMIETADAIAHIEAVAGACARVVAINVGAEDLAAELAIPSDSDLLVRVKERMIVAAFANGVVPLGHLGSVKAFGDIEHFTEMLQRSRSLGFRGATCLNARQASAINAVYRPSTDCGAAA
ncbi:MULTISPECIES: aldolase/citrate lyase family protein [Pandoraea]|uniref:HpcH/HpaI aldolase/citrate lyase family protein n=1 Tax=Pandoraea TaxID=93217 RepID=UPI0024145E40|nr:MULTISPECIES: aldolase/citrate lyase family protein [Pandoraea]MCI3206405.1 CoA ester lyase [Pandoraea sp. LA3]MDN4584433.1 CoA ester lyase [Pandoraea capi]